MYALRSASRGDAAMVQPATMNRFIRGEASRRSNTGYTIQDALAIVLTGLASRVITLQGSIKTPKFLVHSFHR